MLFQLNIPNCEQATERMRMRASAVVAIADVAADAGTAYGMRGVVRVGNGEALGDAELGFDQIEPGGIGRRVDGDDPQLAEEREEAGVIVDVWEVVENDVQATPRIADAQPLERRAQFHDAFAFCEDTGEAVGVDIIEAKERFHALQPAIGGAHAMGPAARGPRPAAHRFQLERSPLVEADDRRARRTLAVERLDAFFFDRRRGRARSSRCGPAGP